MRSAQYWFGGYSALIFWPTAAIRVAHPWRQPSTAI
eukprot:COSAG06_NODE_54534_length_294_cov_0.707692_2_plen_35_part_01